MNSRFLLLLAAPISTSFAADVQLDISSGFNTDNWTGYREYQAIRADGSTNLTQAQGSSEFTVGQGRKALDAFNNGMIGSIDQATANAQGIGLNDGTDYYGYSTTGGGYETGGSPLDGVINGTSKTYHIASHAGNATLPGDWLEATDVSFVGSGSEVTSLMATKFNAMTIYTAHNRASGAAQIASITATFDVGQQMQYSSINFVLGGWDAADGARNAQIVAVYADDSEEIIYSFSTNDEKVGPLADDSATDVTPPGEFTIVGSYTRAYNNSSGSSGSTTDSNWSLFEFSDDLVLNGSKVLKAIRLEDSNPNLNWNERGLSIYGATATLVPEPGIYALSAGVIAGLLALRRRRR